MSNTLTLNIHSEIVDEFKKRNVNISDFVRQAMQNHINKHWTKHKETSEEQELQNTIQKSEAAYEEWLKNRPKEIYIPPTDEEYERIKKEREQNATKND